MYYYETDIKSPRRWAIIASILYVLTIGLSFWLISFDFGREPETTQGIFIDFGTTQDGAGEEDLQATEVISTPKPTASTQAPEVDILTVEESIIAVKSVDVKDKVKSKETTTEVVAKPVVEPRKVNTKALFPGRTMGSKAKSEGTTTGEGNAGDISGTPQGDHIGTGKGDEGLDFDLTGRSIIGSLPKPLYYEDASGKVIIAITVGSNGKVRTANYQLQGSTTSNETLVKAAQNAALKAQFTDSESLLQSGTITYIFRMN